MISIDELRKRVEAFPFSQAEVARRMGYTPNHLITGS